MATDLLSEIRSELDARLEQLRPVVAEYEQLLHAASALDLDGASPTEPVRSAGSRKAATSRRKSSPPPAAPRVAGTSALHKPRVARKQPAVPGVVREAILGVLEHGSHTVGELVVVTAMSTAALNDNLRELAAQGVVIKTEREGKTAWSLVGAG
jgi:hypothetical protein